MSVDDDTAKQILRWSWAIAGSFQCSCGVFGRDDLASIGVMYALKRLPFWDKRKGTLCTYMHHCIRGAIRSYLRQYLGGRRKFGGYQDHKTVRFGCCEDRLNHNMCRERESSWTGTVEARNQDGSAAFEAKDFLRHLRQSLSRREYMLLILRYGRGMTLREVADVLGCTQSHVSQMEKGLRMRLGLPHLFVCHSFDLRVRSRIPKRMRNTV